MARHKVFITLLFSFTYIFSYLSVVHPATTSYKPISMEDFVGMAPQQGHGAQAGHNVNTFFANWSYLIEKVSNLNYYTTQQIVLDANDFDIKDLGYELSIDFRFRGSGSIMLPLPKVKVTVVRKKFQVDNNQEEEVSLYGLGRVLVQNELGKRAHQLPGVNWFANMELSPLHVFFLKLILLAKTELAKGNGAYNFVQEAARLVMRLSISEPFASNIGALLNIEELHDDVIATVLLKMLSHLVPNDWLAALQELTKMFSHAGTGVSEGTVYTIIFNKQAADLAQQCSAKVLHEGIAAIEQLLTANRYEITRDYAYFVRVNNGRNNPFGKKVVFLGTRYDLPESVQSQITASVSQVKTVELTDKGFQAVVWCSPELCLRDTLCSVLAALVTGFQEYVAAKLPMQGMPSQRVAQLEKEADSRAKVIAFNDTELGKESLKRIRAGIMQIVSDAKKDLSSKEDMGYLQEQLASLEDELTGLYIQLNKLKTNLAQLETLESAGIVKISASLQQQLAAKRSEYRRVNEQLAAKEKGKIALQEQLAKLSLLQDDKTLEQKRRDMQELIGQIKQQKIAGVAVDQELLDLIQQLKTEIEEGQAAKKCGVSLEDKYRARVEAVAFYQQEADEVQQRFQQWQQQVLRKKHGVEKKKALLEIAAQKPLCDAYCGYLHSLAQATEKENALLQELMMHEKLKEELGASVIDSEEVSKMGCLTLRLSFILQDDHCFGLSTDIHSSWFDAREVVEDLLSDNPRFEKARIALFHSKDVIRKALMTSNYWKDNEPVCEYLIKLLPHTVQHFLSVA